MPFSLNFSHPMGVALLLANLGARFATDAVFLVGDRHHLLFVLLILVVVRIDRDSLAILVDGADKFRLPQFAARKGDSKGRHEKSSPMVSGRRPQVPGAR